MSTYDISVIIPVYNAEKFIEKALGSLTKQTFPFNKIEVILIEDKSIDSSLDILKKFDQKYNNIKLIINQKNKGINYNKNIGLKKASAEYIMFLDNDDYFENDTCEVLLNYIKKYNCDIVSGRYKKIYGNTPVKIPSLNKDIFIESYKEHPEILSETLFLWNKIYKKSFIEKEKIYFPEYGIEDIVFNTKVYLKAKKMYFIKDKYVYYKRIHEESFTNRRSGNFFYDYLEGLKLAYQMFKKDDALDYLKYFFNLRINALFNYLSHLSSDGEEKIEALNNAVEFTNTLVDNNVKFDEKIRILMILHKNEKYDEIWGLLKYMDISKKRYENIKIFKERNKKMANKNKLMSKKNRMLREKNKKLKDDINYISSWKGFIRFKIKKILRK
ncbi:glycosyltransferase family 2 protein [Methanobrevibacter curvatus]|uniref:Putative glycosyltransferase EpsH n=1 Tax=Methanobrevibacter curvatus TaxID=49547 RepID=A0A165ZRA9_9EURY|nr:glycosyltransferase family 2 protein [Methanobrevibacter curvatus]KZX11063.1 putative glycosyltransferase EpsH [Methanobrevibacter curvatus]